MSTVKEDNCQRPGCLKKCSNRMVAGLERLFYRLGRLVARNPLKTITLCVLVCGLMGVGMMKWHEETEYRKLFLPRGSRMNKEFEWVNEHFPRQVRFESLIVEDDNILTPEAINAMFDVYLATRSIQTRDGNNLTTLCLRAGTICRVNSLLELWRYNETVIRALTQSDIVTVVNQETIISPMFNNEIDIEKILGHISRNEEDQIIGAQATTMLWYIDNNKTTEHATLEWERHLIRLVTEENHPPLKNISIYTERTFDDEAVGTIDNDINLLSAGFSLVFLYLTFSISQFSVVHHKIFLAMAGLLSIGMAVMFTYGFCFATGIVFGPINKITPFLLLGIGVDDIFIIVECLNNLSVKERDIPVYDRIANAMKHAGVSITVTSVTDIVAFAIGSTTVIPALSTFCIYTAIGVFALYIFQATFFVACLALDEQRIDSNRNACILCYKYQYTYEPNALYTFSVQHQFMKKVLAPSLTKTPVKVVVIAVVIGMAGLNSWSVTRLESDFDHSMYLPPDSYSRKFVAADRKYFPDDGAYVQLYCGDIEYADNIDRLVTLYERVREQSTVQSSSVDFWLVSFLRWMEYSSVTGQNQGLVLNFTDQPTLSATKSSHSPLTTRKYLKEHVLDSFRDVSEETSTGSVPVSSPTDIEPRTTNKTERSKRTQRTPYNLYTVLLFTSLSQFLGTPQGQPYQVVLKLDNFMAPTQITASMMTFRHVKCQTSKCGVDSMKDMRELVDGLTLRGGGSCFVYSDPEYMISETNKILKTELYRNLALAAVSVFLVTLVLITNLWTSVLVFICVVFTVVDVAGTMGFLGISIDTASSVILVLCFGLAVDYSAHVGHSFMAAHGSRNALNNADPDERALVGAHPSGSTLFANDIIDSFPALKGLKKIKMRLKKTVVGIGPAVLSGGISTFLACFLLVMGVNYICLLFFRIFTSVVVFGLFHGLAFLPVILSIVGPPPYDTPDPDIRTKDSVLHNDNIVTNCNGHVINVEDGRVKENGITIRCNGQPRPDISEESPDTDLSHVPDETNPRYSGSYYEKLSSGSYEQIPFTP